MGKKGLSAEQKQQKLLELFHEAEAPFTLKELEKGAKSKGLNSMLVKGLLKDLVRRGLPAARPSPEGVRFRSCVPPD